MYTGHEPFCRRLGFEQDSLVQQTETCRVPRFPQTSVVFMVCRSFGISGSTVLDTFTHLSHQGVLWRSPIPEHSVVPYECHKGVASLSDIPKFMGVLS